MKNKEFIRYMVEIAIFAGLGLALDFLCGLISGMIWPNGGSISIAMVPIFIMGYKYGLKGGMLTGVLIGTIQIFWGYIVHPIQVILDYPLAYMVVGSCGIFKKQVKTNNNLIQTIFISLGIILGCSLRLLSATLSGVWYWNITFIPSLVYNGTYILLSMIICIFVTVPLVRVTNKIRQN